jgi:uncharacterized repeat protein (TIGR01451 family)
VEGKVKKLWIVAAVLLSMSTLARGEGNAPQQIFIVDNPGDAPADSVPVFFPRTLRAAIQCANYTSGLDEIRFVAIGLIQPVSPLPNITHPILLDGRITTAKITLDGSLIPTPPLGQSYVGLAVVGGASVVTDVEIKGFPSGGILLRENNNILRRCDIHDNGRPTTSGPGINVVSSSNNIIALNAIYGNNAEGIILLASSNSNRIDSNLIGTPDGFTRAPNASGIHVETGNNRISENVISGNIGSGIELFRGGPDTSKFNLIAYNNIGTTQSGGDSLPNGGHGIQALAGVADTIFGNLISGNLLDGIALSEPVRDMEISENIIGREEGPPLSLPNRSGINSSGMNIFIINNAVSGNANEGIALQNSGRAIIKGNRIGVDYRNEVVPNGTVGIAIRSSSNHVIGGIWPEDRNVISGNLSWGIEINGLTASENLITGNYIGTDSSGIESAPNGGGGVIITQGTFNNTIQSNVISGNTGHGILVTPRFGQVPHDNQIVRNYIGTVAGGMSGLGNTLSGVAIMNARNTMVGSNAIADGNVISGNLLDGVLITGDTARSNTVVGNLIGLAANGQGMIPNQGAGVTLLNASDNDIGDNLAQSPNYIGGNTGPGVWLFGEGSTGNIVTNNVIGLAAGAFIYPNSSGIVIDGASNNFIGSGPLGAPQNVIAHNKGDGVRVLTTARANFIRWNSIYENDELGIDHSNDGVTANDQLDLDAGPNMLQNFPVLNVATIDAAGLHVYGTLSSTPLAEYQLDFYSNELCDPGNYGEGKTFLGFTNITMDATGAARFHVVLPVVPITHFITATAIDTSSNTSEFARCIPISLPGEYADLSITVTDSVDTVDRGDSLTYWLKVVNDGPSSAVDVVVKDTLPDVVTFLVDSSSQGMCTYSDRVLTCLIPSLAPSTEITIKVFTHADSAGEAVTKTSVTSSTVDPNPTNNRALDTTLIRLPAAVVDRSDTPAEYNLDQNYPNPFNPKTGVRFQVPAVSDVKLVVFDVLGRQVAVLLNERKTPGSYEVSFDASGLSSGVYYYRLSAGMFVQTRTMLLIR